jgi:hypothetical protein
MADYTPHQKRIIERYYDHRDEIMLGKLQEIVTELYLATTEKKQNQLWSRAEKAMAQLKAPGSIVAHILAQRKPELLALHVKTWLAEATKGRGSGK